MQDKQGLREEIIAGRNPVTEALKSGRAADALLIAKGATKVGAIIALAKERGITVKDVSPQKLDFLCGGVNHQGVVLTAAAHEYVTMDRILQIAEEKGEPPFVLMCDGLTDPHNLGALIRTADACGVHGVIIPERGGVGLTATVAKASAGAIEYVPVAKVKNLVSAMESLKERGLWFYCADMDGQDYRKTDYSGGVCIVVGAEGNGVSRLVREKCDFIVSVPMKGKINSLNASVAGAVLMFEAARNKP